MRVEIRGRVDKMKDLDVPKKHIIKGNGREILSMIV